MATHDTTRTDPARRYGYVAARHAGRDLRGHRLGRAECLTDSVGCAGTGKLTSQRVEASGGPLVISGRSHVCSSAHADGGNRLGVDVGPKILEVRWHVARSGRKAGDRSPAAIGSNGAEGRCGRTLAAVWGESKPSSYRSPGSS